MKTHNLLLSILLIAISATSLGLILHHSGKDQRPQNKTLCGGYTEQREFSENEMALFNRLLGDTIFTPLSVATQVVAGTNYRFWCKYDDGSANSPGYCSVTIYQPLQGDAVLSGIKDEDGGPQMKVIIGDDGNTGRYIGENETSYHGEIQDEYWIEKGKAKTEIVKACEGKGILTLKEPGKKAVFSRPDSKAGEIGTLIYEEGCIPEVYRCLGYIKGWFLTEIDGKAGFVREDLVAWDAVNSF